MRIRLLREDFLMTATGRMLRQWQSSMKDGEKILAEGDALASVPFTLVGGSFRLFRLSAL